MGVNVTGLGWVFAGELAWKFDGVDILTYCVDIANTLGNPQTVYVESISNLTGASSDSGKKVAWLYNSYSGAAHQSDLLAAALQVAIWEVIGGNSFTLSSLSAPVGSVALELLTTLAGANYGASDATWLNVDLAKGYKGQDQVTRSVPEPGTLLLLGAGAAALAARRRLRRAS